MLTSQPSLIAQLKVAVTDLVKKKRRRRRKAERLLWTSTEVDLIHTLDTDTQMHTHTLTSG